MKENKMNPSQNCTLCGSSSIAYFGNKPAGPVHRNYYLCRHCQLIFVPKNFHLSAKEEKHRYDQHNNDVDCPNYQNFLNKLLQELRPYLQMGSQGLDVGAGPGPALARMLTSEGYPTSVYDPYFHPNTQLMETRYDFVTCTETVEHFRNPIEGFEQLNQVVRTGGVLGIMTGIKTSWDNFSNWYYARDPTHICFYCPTTFQWIAERFSWKQLLMKENVVLFQKGPLDNSSTF